MLRQNTPICEPALSARASSWHRGERRFLGTVFLDPLPPTRLAKVLAQ
jgi:hypothetical protein